MNTCRHSFKGFEYKHRNTNFKDGRYCEKCKRVELRYDCNGKNETIVDPDNPSRYIQRPIKMEPFFVQYVGAKPWTAFVSGI